MNDGRKWYLRRPCKGEIAQPDAPLDRYDDAPYQSDAGKCHASRSAEYRNQNQSLQLSRKCSGLARRSKGMSPDAAWMTAA